MSALVCLLLSSWFAGDLDHPGFALQEGRRLMISLPEPHLTEPRVNKMLYSGLTTSFAFALRARSEGGGVLVGGARVDVRYEPWDEVFYVTLVVADRKENTTLASFRELVVWFTDYHIPIADMRGFAPQVWRLDLLLKVLPFSESEQADTQKWFAETLSNESNKNDPNTVLDVLLATSIKRKSLISDSWSLELSL